MSQTLDIINPPTKFKKFPQWLENARRSNPNLSPLGRNALDLLQNKLQTNLDGEDEQDRCVHFAKLALQVLAGERTWASLAMTIDQIPGIPEEIAKSHNISRPSPCLIQSQGLQIQ